MFDDEAENKEVISKDGLRIGKVKRIQFDERTWKIDALEVQLEPDVAEEFQMKRHFRKTHVLIHVGHVQAVADKVILLTSREELLKLVAANSPENSTASSSIPKEAEISSP